MSIATLHHYNVATTVELSDESVTRLTRFLEDLAREQGPSSLPVGAVVWGKTGELEIDTFNPVVLMKEGA